jgi:ABC-type transport system substrate-binding protein
VLGGFGMPAQSTLPPFTSGYDPAYKSEMSDYSPARAKALLDLHGYVDRNGDGWREQPDGRPLVLSMAGMSTQQRPPQANELGTLHDRGGPEDGVRSITWPELLKKSRAGTLMMWGYTWSAASPDGGFFLAIAYGPNASESNDPRFALPAFDRLFERQRVLPDGPEREAVMRQAKNLLVAYLPFKVHVHTATPSSAGPGASPGTRGLLAPPLHARHLALRETLLGFANVGAGAGAETCAQQGPPQPPRHFARRRRQREARQAREAQQHRLREEGAFSQLL